MLAAALREPDTVRRRLSLRSSFKRYHADHHKYQGEDGLDGDIPCELETKLVTAHSVLMKTVWVILQPAAYALRPVLTMPKRITVWEVINAVVVIAVDVLVYIALGPKGLLYCLLGTLLGASCRVDVVCPCVSVNPPCRCKRCEYVFVSAFVWVFVLLYLAASASASACVLHSRPPRVTAAQAWVHTPWLDTSSQSTTRSSRATRRTRTTAR